MATFQQRDNSGALFKNDKREKETHPHYKGDVVIGGVEMWISAWLKDTKTGSKMMSLSFTPKEKKSDKPKEATKQKTISGSGFEDMDDDTIPF